MPKPVAQSSSRLRQIKAHNKKALEEGRTDDILPEQSQTQVWEPHEYNAKIAERAKERGEPVNIAQPRVPKGFVVTTKEPEMRDLAEEAKERAQALKAPKKKFKGGLKVDKPD